MECVVISTGTKKPYEAEGLKRFLAAANRFKRQPP